MLFEINTLIFILFNEFNLENLNEYLKNELIKQKITQFILKIVSLIQINGQEIFFFIKTPS